MQSTINWHLTAEELPEQKEVFRGQKKVFYIDAPVLVIWQGEVKVSRYHKETKSWDYMPTPEYWAYLDDIVTE